MPEEVRTGQCILKAATCIPQIDDDRYYITCEALKIKTLLCLEFKPIKRVV